MKAAMKANLFLAGPLHVAPAVCRTNGVVDACHIDGLQRLLLKAGYDDNPWEPDEAGQRFAANFVDYCASLAGAGVDRIVFKLDTDTSLSDRIGLALEALLRAARSGLDQGAVDIILSVAETPKTTMLMHYVDRLYDLGQFGVKTGIHNFGSTSSTTLFAKVLEPHYALMDLSLVNGIERLAALDWARKAELRLAVSGMADSAFLSSPEAAGVSHVQMSPADPLATAA